MNSVTRIPMTVIGRESLRKELHQLKNIDRPKISQAIADARELGDLKENAEYHAAREQQGFIEARIREIEHKLSLAQIIDVTSLPKSDKVIFGSTVKLLNLDTDQTVSYKIVGEDEADIKQGKISVTSPVARAIVAKQVGDEVEIHIPRGSEVYQIVQVDYV